LAGSFAVDAHVEVEEVSWGVYQRLVAAYREPNKKKGKLVIYGTWTLVRTALSKTP
jgi:hypothetical protein